MAEITEKQRQLAAEWEENKKREAAAMQAKKENLLACDAEAEKVTKFLSGLNLKMRKTILAVKGLNQQKQQIEKTYSIEYVLGEFCPLITYCLKARTSTSPSSATQKKFSKCARRSTPCRVSMGSSTSMIL